MAKQQTQKPFDGEALAELVQTVVWIKAQLTESRILLRQGQISHNNGSSWESCPWLEQLAFQAQKVLGDQPVEIISDDMPQNEEWKPAE